MHCSSDRLSRGAMMDMNYIVILIQDVPGIQISI